MKGSVYIVWVALLFWTCGHKVEPSDIAKINGYWEIEKAVKEDGSEKYYAMNETYDYFEIRDNKGFRKKVMPQLDGTFQTNGISEKVTVVFENDKVWLQYATSYSKWREELLSLSDSAMVLLNVEKKEYHYKKTGPINLTRNGEKTK